MNKTIKGIHVRTTDHPFQHKIYATAVEDSLESYYKLLGCDTIGILPVSVYDARGEAIPCSVVYADDIRNVNRGWQSIFNGNPSLQPRIFHAGPYLHGDIFLCGPVNADGELTSLTREQIHGIVKHHADHNTIFASHR